MVSTGWLPATSSCSSTTKSSQTCTQQSASTRSTAPSCTTSSTTGSSSIAERTTSRGSASRVSPSAWSPTKTSSWTSSPLGSRNEPQARQVLTLTHQGHTPYCPSLCTIVTTTRPMAPCHSSTWPAVREGQTRSRLISKLESMALRSTRAYSHSKSVSEPSILRRSTHPSEVAS